MRYSYSHLFGLQTFIFVLFIQILLLKELSSEETKTTGPPTGTLSRLSGLKSVGIQNGVKVYSAARNIYKNAKQVATTYVSGVVTDVCLNNLDDKYDVLDQYMYLRGLQKNQPEDFYKCLINNVERIAPIVYMPVVAKASKNYKTIVKNDLQIGLIINMDDANREITVELMIWTQNNPNSDVSVVLVTDGERVLGVGDQGANSLAFLEGKAAMHSSLGGVHPGNILTVALDVGTNNQNHLRRKHAKYAGNKRQRTTDKLQYSNFITEFVEAVHDAFGETTLIQFEGFSTENEYSFLKTFQETYPIFIDNIQGAAATTLAGVLGADKLRRSSSSITQAKVLIVGADTVYESALGIGTLMVEANFKSDNIYMMDKKGLLTDCSKLEDKNAQLFCHQLDKGQDTVNLENIVLWLKPNVLIGVSGAKDLFTQKVLDNMKKANVGQSPPIIMLECTIGESYIYAKGNLFTANEKLFEEDSEGGSKKSKKRPWKTLYDIFLTRRQNFEIVQCNDNYIFPGIVQGVILAQMKKVPNKVFAIAAETMATECIKKYNDKTKSIYPSLPEWMDCSVSIAAAIVQFAVKEGLSNLKSNPPGMESWTLNEYKVYVKEKQYKVGVQWKLKKRIREYLKTDCVKGVDAMLDGLSKYIYLRRLQVEKQEEFYKCIIENLEKMLPIIYTPVVGKACKNYKIVVDKGGNIGLTLSYKKDKGQIENRLREWKNKHQPEVKAIVVTDGGRILGLGDLGANGMGIPVGKLALYTALGGIDPKVCLPVTLDVGTNTEELRGVKKHKYIGIDMGRIKDKEYDDFIDEFVKAVIEVYGKTTLIQFEDFANPTAYPILKRYQDKYTVFNDDIQGTAATAVAGILAAARFRNTKIDDAKVLFVGAGSAALGIGTLIVQAMEGGDIEKNRKKIYMKDVYGLLTSEKCGHPTPFDENDGRRKFCHNEEPNDFENLENIILWLKPNILIGVSGVQGLFTPKVLENMAAVNKEVRPIIMPLSNPTSKSECTAEEAYKYAKGCFFASGSPFAPVYVDNEVLQSLGHELSNPNGKHLKPAQCNNDNIFPGVALGIVVAEMVKVPEHVFLLSAETLAYKCLQKSDFENGSLYPEPKHLRTCSVKVAAAVVEYAFNTKGLSALKEKPDGWETWTFEDYEAFVKEKQYNP